jgi:hypothetical protein
MQLGHSVKSSWCVDRGGEGEHESVGAFIVC